MISESVDFI